MRKLQLLTFTILFILSEVSAQQTVTGTITDNNGIPLSGVSIRSVKTGRGTITNATGTFRLQAAANDELEITMVGYMPQRVTVGSQADFTISMTESVTELSQIVFVGSRSAGRVKTQTPVPVDIVNMTQASLPTAR